MSYPGDLPMNKYNPPEKYEIESPLKSIPPANV